MPRLTIPKGSKIDQIEGKTVKIKIKNTEFWIYGEQKENYLWNAYIVDPKIESEANQKTLIKENITTKSFILFSNAVLKTPFPYERKNTVTLTIIKSFINKLTQ